MTHRVSEVWPFRPVGTLASSEHTEARLLAHRVVGRFHLPVDLCTVLIQQEHANRQRKGEEARRDIGETFAHAEGVRDIPERLPVGLQRHQVGNRLDPPGAVKPFQQVFGAGDDQFAVLGQRRGPAEVVALCEVGIAIEAQQRFRFRFHAFDGNEGANFMQEANQPPQTACIAMAHRRLSDQFAIELDHIRTQIPDPAQVGFASAKIVERDEQAMLP
jgi:hypothetical protein